MSRTPQASLEKIMEDIGPLAQQYDRATDQLKEAYEKTHEARKRFLEIGIEYTKPQKSDSAAFLEEDILGQGLIKAYDDCKAILESRISAAKTLLSSVSLALSTVDQQLLLLDSPFDPKFGIQTQNPRIYKTNKKNPCRLLPAEEAEERPAERTYCTCNGPAFGDMVSCDSYHTEGSWFHMECVNCPPNPKGHWFCPKCNPPE